MCPVRHCHTFTPSENLLRKHAIAAHPPTHYNSILELVDGAHGIEPHEHTTFQCDLIASGLVKIVFTEDDIFAAMRERDVDEPIAVDDDGVVEVDAVRKMEPENNEEEEKDIADVNALLYVVPASPDYEEVTANTMKGASPIYQNDWSIYGLADSSTQFRTPASTTEVDSDQGAYFEEQVTGLDIKSAEASRAFNSLCNEDDSYYSMSIFGPDEYGSGSSEASTPDTPGISPPTRKSPCFPPHIPFKTIPRLVFRSGTRARQGSVSVRPDSPFQDVNPFAERQTEDDEA